MDRPGAAFQLRWLMLPASWVLLVSALSLPRHGYTGVSLHPPDGRIESADPASPGALAGLRAGDRLSSPDAGRAGDESATSPLAGAAPGVPLVVRRERAGAIVPVWIAPSALPDAERRFLAIQFAVAAAFMLLG